MKALTITLLFLMTAVSIFSLISGAPYLMFLLPGGLPAGNVIAALGLICPSAIAVLISKRGTVLKAVALGTFYAALLWLPVSILFAGNLALNFTGWRGSAWFDSSAVVFLIILIVLGWALVNRLLVIRQSASE